MTTTIPQLSKEQRATNRKSTIMSISDVDRGLRAAKAKQFFCYGCCSPIPALYGYNSETGKEFERCGDCNRATIMPDFKGE